VEEENGDSDSEGVCYLLGDTLCPVRKMEEAAVESRTKGSSDKERYIFRPSFYTHSGLNLVVLQFSSHSHWLQYQ
jgi:hypothetical protein